MAVRIKYQWNDTGWREVRSAVSKLGSTKVHAGILGSAAEQQHPNSDLSVGEVALVNEFGSNDGHVPERSYVRRTFREKKRTIVSLIARASIKVVHLQQSAESALNFLGNAAAHLIRDTIDAGVPPHNADATVERKGFDHPLIETGVLKDAVTHRVVKGGEHVRILDFEGLESEGDLWL